MVYKRDPTKANNSTVERIQIPPEATRLQAAFISDSCSITPSEVRDFLTEEGDVILPRNSAVEGAGSDCSVELTTNDELSSVGDVHFHTPRSFNTETESEDAVISITSDREPKGNAVENYKQDAYGLREIRFDSPPCRTGDAPKAFDMEIHKLEKPTADASRDIYVTRVHSAELQSKGIDVEGPMCQKYCGRFVGKVRFRRVEVPSANYVWERQGKCGMKALDIQRVKGFLQNDEDALKDSLLLGENDPQRDLTKNHPFIPKDDPEIKVVFEIGHTKCCSCFVFVQVLIMYACTLLWLFVALDFFMRVRDVGNQGGVECQLVYFGWVNLILVIGFILFIIICTVMSLCCERHECARCVVRFVNWDWTRFWTAFSGFAFAIYLLYVLVKAMFDVWSRDCEQGCCLEGSTAFNAGRVLYFLDIGCIFFWVAVAQSTLSLFIGQIRATNCGSCIAFSCCCCIARKRNKPYFPNSSDGGDLHHLRNPSVLDISGKMYREQHEKGGMQCTHEATAEKVVHVHKAKDLQNHLRSLIRRHDSTVRVLQGVIPRRDGSVPSDLRDHQQDLEAQDVGVFADIVENFLDLMGMNESLAKELCEEYSWLVPVMDNPRFYRESYEDDTKLTQPTDHEVESEGEEEDLRLFVHINARNERRRNEMNTWQVHESTHVLNVLCDCLTIVVLVFVIGLFRNGFSTNSYYQTSAVRRTLESTPFNDMFFKDISTVHHVWTYLHAVVLPFAYGNPSTSIPYEMDTDGFEGFFLGSVNETYPNWGPPSEDIPFTTWGDTHANTLHVELAGSLVVITPRELNHDCGGFGVSCVARFPETMKAPWAKWNNITYIDEILYYNSSKEMHVEPIVQTNAYLLPGNGYKYVFPDRANGSAEGSVLELAGRKLDALFAHGFIDQHTIATFWDLRFYNANTDLTTLVRIIFATPPMGGVEPFLEISTFFVGFRWVYYLLFSILVFVLITRQYLHNDELFNACIHRGSCCCRNALVELTDEFYAKEERLAYKRTKQDAYNLQQESKFSIETKEWKKIMKKRELRNEDADLRVVQPQNPFSSFFFGPFSASHEKFLSIPFLKIKTWHQESDKRLNWNTDQEALEPLNRLFFQFPREMRGYYVVTEGPFKRIPKYPFGSRTLFNIYYGESANVILVFENKKLRTDFHGNCRADKYISPIVEYQRTYDALENDGWNEHPLWASALVNWSQLKNNWWLRLGYAVSKCSSIPRLAFFPCCEFRPTKYTVYHKRFSATDAQQAAEDFGLYATVDRIGELCGRVALVVPDQNCKCWIEHVKKQLKDTGYDSVSYLQDVTAHESEENDFVLISHAEVRQCVKFTMPFHVKGDPKNDVNLKEVVKQVLVRIAGIPGSAITIEDTEKCTDEVNMVATFHFVSKEKCDDVRQYLQNLQVNGDDGLWVIRTKFNKILAEDQDKLWLTHLSDWICDQKNSSINFSLEFTGAGDTLACLENEKIQSIIKEGIIDAFTGITKGKKGLEALEIHETDVVVKCEPTPEGTYILHCCIEFKEGEMEYVQSCFDGLDKAEFKSYMMPCMLKAVNGDPVMDWCQDVSGPSGDPPKRHPQGFAESKDKHRYINRPACKNPNCQCEQELWTVEVKCITGMKASSSSARRKKLPDNVPIRIDACCGDFLAETLQKRFKIRLIEKPELQFLPPIEKVPGFCVQEACRSELTGRAQMLFGKLDMERISEEFTIFFQEKLGDDKSEVMLVKEKQNYRHPQTVPFRVHFKKFLGMKGFPLVLDSGLQVVEVKKTANVDENGIVGPFLIGCRVMRAITGDQVHDFSGKDSTLREFRDFIEQETEKRQGGRNGAWPLEIVFQKQTKLTDAKSCSSASLCCCCANLWNCLQDFKTAMKDPESDIESLELTTTCAHQRVMSLVPKKEKDTTPFERFYIWYKDAGFVLTAEEEQKFKEHLLERRVLDKADLEGVEWAPPFRGLDMKILVSKQRLRLHRIWDCPCMKIIRDIAGDGCAKFYSNISTIMDIVFVIIFSFLSFYLLNSIQSQGNDPHSTNSIRRSYYHRQWVTYTAAICMAIMFFRLIRYMPTFLPGSAWFAQMVKLAWNKLIDVTIPFVLLIIAFATIGWIVLGDSEYQFRSIPSSLNNMLFFVFHLPDPNSFNGDSYFIYFFVFLWNVMIIFVILNVAVAVFVESFAKTDKLTNPDGFLSTIAFKRLLQPCQLCRMKKHTDETIDHDRAEHDIHEELKWHLDKDHIWDLYEEVGAPRENVIKALWNKYEGDLGGDDELLDIIYHILDRDNNSRVSKEEWNDLRETVQQGIQGRQHRVSYLLFKKLQQEIEMAKNGTREDFSNFHKLLEDVYRELMFITEKIKYLDAKEEGKRGSRMHAHSIRHDSRSWDRRKSTAGDVSTESKRHLPPYPKTVRH